MIPSVVARKATKLLALATKVSQGLPQLSTSISDVEGGIFDQDAKEELSCLLNEEEQGTLYIAS
jgi:hypothetical protein